MTKQELVEALEQAQMAAAEGECADAEDRLAEVLRDLEQMEGPIRDEPDEDAGRFLTGSAARVMGG